ncbi:MAG TPA: MATE family efflux transporter [Acidimicrobiia bacterium]|nr:MATE family efflux transporter [Acidimicrobiia bacterium]
MRSIDRRIFALAIPALGALAAEPLLALADTFFVSQLGANALGALAVNGAVFGFVFVVFNFLAYVTTPMVARAQGAGDRERASEVIFSSLVLAIGLGVITTLILIFFARPILLLVQTGPEVIGPALDYLRIKAVAAPAVLVILAGHGSFRGLADTRTPLLITVVINALNAVIDPILIFGLNMGVSGAALGSVAAQFIGAGLFVFYLRRRLGLLRWTGRASLHSLLRPGALITARTLFLVSTLSISTAAVARIGVDALAAHQILRETWFLSAMLVDGLAIAAQTLVAEATGRGDPEEENNVIRRLLWWGSVMGAVLAGLWLVSGPPLAAIFAPTAAVASELGRVTSVLAILAVPAAWLWVLDGVVLGQLRLARMMASSGLGLLAAAGLLVVVVGSGWGLVGVWWALGLMILARLLVLLPGVFPTIEEEATGLGEAQGQQSRH